MPSCNVPVPGRVKRLAADLRPDLAAFDRVRERHGLVVKRFEGEDANSLASEVRIALVGTPAFEIRTAGIDFFAEPTKGPGPVVYLAVESPGLRSVHEHLVERFGAIPELEGAEYVPHVTLARGGDVADAERLAERSVADVTWTVSQLHLWDERLRETTARIGLPA